MYVKSECEHACDYKAECSDFKQQLSFFLGLEAPEVESLFPKLAGPPNKLYF